MSEVILFVGGLTRLDEEGQFSGIFKRATSDALHLLHDGLTGDQQADRRVHGGPEKAVHHYAAENYAQLAAHFPACAAQLQAGSLGENISAYGWNENNVCIGDIFRLGSAELQVSQPRSPCWKIDHRHAAPGMARFIAESGLTGWYYRVLKPGTVASGHALQLVERLPGALPLAELWQVWSAHRPSLDALQRCAAAPALTPGWQKKLQDRRQWLHDNADDAASAATFHVKPPPAKER